ncbi:MAG: hypothetical protein NUV75_01385 [Gallionella sp.]|nr:hypothetical protein [Gallionella sp.]
MSKFTDKLREMQILKPTTGTTGTGMTPVSRPTATSLGPKPMTLASDPLMGINLAGPSTTPSAPTAAAPTTGSPPGTAVDQGMFTKILSLIGNVTLPNGFREFVTTMVTLKKNLPPGTTPEQADQMAFATAFGTFHATAGLTKAAIIAALNEQQRALAEVQRQHDANITEQVKAEKNQSADAVSGLTADIVNGESQLRKLAEDYERAKRQLEQQLEQKRRQLGEHQAAAANLAEKETAARQRFELAHAAVINGYPELGWMGIVPLRKLVGEE